LQWFQFPLGLTFQNNFFGTTEMCSFFKVKDLALGTKSFNVDFQAGFWNRFAKECEYLSKVLKDD